MSEKESVLKLTNLCKKYKHYIALNNINLEIKKGEIWALIGRNGAGKTSLLKVITGLAEKTGGEISLFNKSGKNLFMEKKRMGCLVDQAGFYSNFSAYENLKYYAIQRGMVDKNRITEVLKTVGLENAERKKFKNFSLGMKQRLGIALAILNNPDFIILDEPTNGLDPIGISRLREFFLKLNREKNVTMLISSHILSELYLIATNFCFIDNGKIIKILTKEELDNECSKCISLKVRDLKKTVIVLEKKLKTTNYKVINDTEIKLYDYLDNISFINKQLVLNDIEILEIKETGISVEDYFKFITKSN